MKVKGSLRIWLGVIFIVALVVTPFIKPFQQYLSIPNEIITMNNLTPITVPTLGNSVQINSTNESVQAIDSSKFYTDEVGETDLIYGVSGLPIKKVNVSVLEDVKLVPGGQSIGVQLHTLGVLVVGHHQVNRGESISSPGEDAKVKVGDVILKINDEYIKKMEDVKPYVDQAGEDNESLSLTLKRGKETIETTLKPELDQKDKQYRLGLYIRDSAAGIGTMSFYDPKTKKYGALGHVISDMDTKKPIEIHDGTIVRSSVVAIERGNNGSPGEKQAKFSINENKIGSITKNSPFGIFGKLDQPIKNNKYDQPMSIALAHEIKEGPAKILTVLEGEKVEEFDVEIVNSIPQKYPATKGMIIKVTDPRLLEKTGGIVQGMSGSPIIQNDKIVGAVTHVFVNDPTSGYGVHIEWMLQEIGIHINKQLDQAS